MSLRIHEKLVEWTRAGKRVAAITIVETVGSTPRKPGAKMIVSDKMELYGTIGGGCVEADVIFAAREAMRTMTPRVIRVDIKAKNAEELDMLCGGEVSLFVEPVMPDFELLICGGGHISRALAHVSAGLDFRVTVVDDRPQFANRERFPQADAAVCCEYATLGESVRFTPQTFAVVVTRGHTGDEVCLRSLLRSPAPYIAMIGSRTKWAVLRRNLLDNGFTEADLARVKCPAGIDIGSITPEEIAVSVMAEIIAARAVFRQGHGIPPPAEPSSTPEGDR